MKYNIPARTLRDWMKRLNIKSVFTHHSQKDGRSLSADSSEFSLLSGESNPGNPNEETSEEIVPEEDVEKSPDSESKVYAYIKMIIIVLHPWLRWKFNQNYISIKNVSEAQLRLKDFCENVRARIENS